MAGYVGKCVYVKDMLIIRRTLRIFTKLVKVMQFVEFKEPFSFPRKLLMAPLNVPGWGRGSLLFQEVRLFITP